MDTPSATTKYKNHRFLAEIISHAVWLYFRSCLSCRDVEELLLERGIIVTYEAIRKWCRSAHAPAVRHRCDPSAPTHSAARYSGLVQALWLRGLTLVKIAVGAVHAAAPEQTLRQESQLVRCRSGFAVSCLLR